MEIFQIVILGIVVLIILTVLRETNPEMAIILSLVAGVIIFMMILPKLSAIVEVLNTLARKSGLDNIYFMTTLKIIGIAYITEFGVQLCLDANEKNLASKIEIAGKIIIIFLSIPIIVALMETILSIMP
ncbi:MULTISPECIES: stage III sporulation protein AD [Thermoanaerobacter]|uniref:Stage III sporulation protein AD n=3 Tax=Thermoanaerobacter TaxID=1754 RepID=I9KW45_9THEO|nr:MULTISPECIES: stage III sporulation protein AD [Thermoanaerobacter]EGD52275.1 stage III sporulation protein AD [Thermoanaerobacter ethanolicus JW 200]HHY78961.1 stage III sporulation protein AD [Thermoanaerobacter sp.]AEM78658.1 stage III sporulation protein AD [Thermoanaerobacter wiegelii Rt8.B1]EIW01259.1 stage III sporulation protein AD [Thermoanaerobacter siderophilus SR4]EMT40318.1 stage III sporulation protein AD [Thermoanaerobacter thermohydrosulfuricus WC1]